MREGFFLALKKGTNQNLGKSLVGAFKLYANIGKPAADMAERGLGKLQPHQINTTLVVYIIIHVCAL